VSKVPAEPAPAPEQPRRSARRPVSLQGHALRADGASIEIALLDLNYDGCAISTPVELEPGETLRLSIIGRGLIDAEVRWCKDGKAGLRFGSGETLPKDEAQRVADRAALSTEVRVRRIGQNNYNVRIFDLSPDGAKIEVIERPRVGEQLMIKFEGIETVQAEVCWVEGFIAGLKFQRPFHPAVFDLLVARLGQAQP
jgi:hypothetical protein